MCTYESIITRLATHKVLFVGVKTIILYGYVYLCLMVNFFSVAKGSIDNYYRTAMYNIHICII